MIALFWYCKGPILERYKLTGTTINSEPYWELFENHYQQHLELLEKDRKPSARLKRRSLLHSGVLLQHDNAHLHTARVTALQLTNLC